MKYTIVDSTNEYKPLEKTARTLKEAKAICENRIGREIDKVKKYEFHWEADCFYITRS
jgi:hypothetical protein